MRAGVLGILVCGVVGLAVGACSDDDTTPATTPATQDAGPADAGPNTSNGDSGSDAGAVSPFCTNSTVVDFAPGQEQAILDKINQLAECTTVRLAAGTFTFTNAITIRQKNITLIGAGKGVKGELTGTATSTVLSFGTAVNVNGVDHVGDSFTIKDIAIIGAPVDALRIEASKDVRIQSVRAEWKDTNSAANGKYGLYPVKSTNVLLENSEAYNASDAGIYVGQTTNTIVRNNIAKQNVAGIEIENTVDADVYGNTADDNTGGLVVFDLPGNPIAGRNVKIHDNTVTNNNRQNFGAATVGQVPAGTGTFVMASRRVEVSGNTYGNNKTTDVAVISGLSLDPVADHWAASGYNFVTSDVWIHDNTMQNGSGSSVDNGMVDPTKRPLGAALYGLNAYANAGARVEPFVWDGIGLSPTADNKLVNDINLCITGNALSPDTTNAIVDLNLAVSGPLIAAATTPALGAAAAAKTGHTTQGVAPFNCAGINPALAAIVLPE